MSIRLHSLTKETTQLAYKHMKRYLTSYVLDNCKLKTVRHFYSQNGRKPED